MGRIDVDGLLRRIGEVLRIAGSEPPRGPGGRQGSNESNPVCLDGWTGGDALRASQPLAAGGVVPPLSTDDGNGCVLPRPLPPPPPGIVVVQPTTATPYDLAYLGPSWQAAVDAADTNARRVARFSALYRYRVHRAAPGVWIASRIRTKGGNR